MWNVKDIGRLIKQYGGEVDSSSCVDLDAANLVLDIFEQIEACGKEKTSTVNDDKHDCGKKVNIIDIDDSSSDESLVEIPPSTNPMTAKGSEVGANLYYGPLPPVASQAVMLTYSEFGGCRVEQVDINTK